MENIKHTPELYATPINYVGQSIPQVRLVQGGKEIASIVLSGYKVGEELSPMGWAEFIVEACNEYYQDKELISELVEFAREVAARPCETLGLEDMEAGCCETCRARTAIAKAEGK